MVLQKLRNLRLKASLTNQEVADKVGISKEYYWMIENGKRKLSYKLAVKIAKVFHTNPDNIFLDTELTSGERKGKSNEQEVI